MSRSPCPLTASILADPGSATSREHLELCPRCREAAAVDDALRRFASEERAAAARLPHPAVVYQRARLAASLAARSESSERRRRRSLVAALVSWALGLATAFGLWIVFGWLRSPPEALWNALARLGGAPSEAGTALLVSLAFSGLAMATGWLAVRSETALE